MKKTTKNIFACLGAITVFAGYFVLSLSCATNNGVERESGTEVSVKTNLTENKWQDYDITVVSSEKCPSRILKLVQKNGTSGENGKVFYAISDPNDTEVYQTIKKDGMSKKVKVAQDLVTASELKGKHLINEEDAKAAVAFINQLETKFKKERKGDGVLDKFEIFKVVKKSDTVWVKTGASRTGGYVTETGEYQTVEWEEKTRVFFIQHSTAYGKDEILYSANDPKVALPTGGVAPMPPIVVKLEEILAVRDALSK